MLMFLSGIWIGNAEVSIQEQMLNDNKVYILENEYLRLVIDPAAGGRGESLICKQTGEDITYTASRMQAGQGSGLFLDRFWGKAAGQLRDFETRPYGRGDRRRGLPQYLLPQRAKHPGRRL